MALEAGRSILDHARENQFKLARATTHVTSTPASHHTVQVVLPFTSIPCLSVKAPVLGRSAFRHLLAALFCSHSSPALAEPSSCLVTGWETAVPGTSGVIRLCASARLLELFASFSGISTTCGCGFAHRGSTPSTLFAAEQLASMAPAAAIATALARTPVFAFIDDKRIPARPGL